MEQKHYIDEDYQVLQDIPVQPFLEDLRSMCRAAFGEDWTDQSPEAEAMEKLREYDFLPEAFHALYQVIGGEERLLRQGFLPVERMVLEQYSDRNRRMEYLVYRRTKEHEQYAFSRELPLNRVISPTGGIFRSGTHSIDNTRAEWKKWDRWCAWGGPPQSLGTLLLRQVGQALTEDLPNCVWVKLSFKGIGDRSRYEAAAEQLGCTVLNSINICGYEFAYDEVRGMLLKFEEDSQKKCLVYSRETVVLEALGEKYTIIWQKRDGKKILDPKKFIKSSPPMDFKEKLDMTAAVLLGKKSMALVPEEIEKAEKRLRMTFPEALREFYLRFGKGGKLFSDGSLNLIYTPKELQNDMNEEGCGNGSSSEKDGVIPEGDPVLAVENQAVWLLRLERETGLPYLDLGNGERETWGMSLEDTLLWLLAMNGVGFLPRVGECSLEDNEESRVLLGHFFHFLSTGKQAVFVNPQRGLLGCCNGEGSIYIMASRGDALEKLEADADIGVGEL